jgi:phage portal protein BeeE
MKFQPISISNEDAQIVDQMKLNDRAIASVFGVPAILLGITDTATQKSAEALMREWLASGLNFVITHIEQAFDKLIGLATVPAGREWTEFDRHILLETNFKERIEGLARGVQAGIIAPDEARYSEGYAAVPGGFGKMPRVQQQMVSLDFEAAPAPPAAAALPAPPEEQDEPEPPKLDDDERAAIAMIHLQREMTYVRAA